MRQLQLERLLLLLLLLLHSKTLQQPGQSVHCHLCSLQSSACVPRQKQQQQQRQQQRRHEEPVLCLQCCTLHKATASPSQLTASRQPPSTAAGASPQQSLPRLCTGTQTTPLLLLLPLQQQALCLHAWPLRHLQQTVGPLQLLLPLQQQALCLHAWPLRHLQQTVGPLQLLLLLLCLHFPAGQVQQLSTRDAV
jgi:hypothetical protein